MNIEIKFNPLDTDRRHIEQQEQFINDIIGINDEDCVHEDGEPCNCAKCQKAWEEEAAFHLREFRLYCNKDEDGNLIDIRTGNVVCYRI